MINFDWTDKAVERLKLMVAEGASGSEIAAAFGVTRNVIIGKCHRLGLKLSGGQSGAAKASREIKKVSIAKSSSVLHGGKRTISTQRIASLSDRRPRGGIPRPVTPEHVDATTAGWPKPLTATAVRFLDAAFGQCRMILDDRVAILDLMVCGAPVVTGKSWCQACFKLITGNGTPGEREAATAHKARAA